MLYFESARRSKVSCCLRFVLGVGLQPCHCPCIMDRPWPCVVSCLQNPLDICCSQPCLWPCLLLLQAGFHGRTLDLLRHLLVCACWWTPLLTSGSTHCVQSMWDWVLLLKTQLQVEPPLVPGLSTLKEQLCSCCFLMHTFEVASSWKG